MHTSIRRAPAVLVLAALTAGGLALLPGAQAPATAEAAALQDGGAFDVDAGHSGVLFKISHLGVANFYGRFNSISGSYDLRDGGSMDVTIDVNSVDTNSQGRDDHLRGTDFFHVAQFPEATFKSTSMKPTGEDTFEVTGDLTIRGTTESVTVEVTKTGEGDRGPRFGYRSGMETSVTLSRSAFGVSALPEGLGDEVTLMISLEGIRQ